jgi:hypothetical protein
MTLQAEHRVPVEQCEKLSLLRSAQLLLEECRMILPGIQALFGFQLVAVFSERFDEVLSAADQRLHFAAITLVALAIALIMTPAAFHRQVGVDEVTDTFLKLSTRLVLWSMPPLALGICIDFYLVAHVLIGSTLAPWFAAAIFAVFFTLWVILPRARALQRLTLAIPRRA